MSDKRETRREALRERLVLAAHQRIGAQGLAALRARDLAKDVGCALGAIYNAFEDLDALVLTVNLRTLMALNAALTSGQADPATTAPTARLVALAHVYCDFAAAHPNHWRALFEHRMPQGTPVPSPFTEARDALFQHIATPLADVMPDADHAAVALRARTLFAAVHGVVAFWLEGRFDDADAATMKDELKDVIEAYARGI